jgi:5-methylcytosine-specific restriction endonuclease McrA
MSIHDLWYTSRRWRRLRWQVLVRDCFRCAICHHVNDSSQLVCDHITPHRGDATLFWSGPFQTLCKQCHDSVKQSIEKGGTKQPKPQIGLDGWPVQ